MTVAFTVPIAPTHRGRHQDEDRPEQFPKDLYGFPEVTLPYSTSSWSSLSGCVVGGMELPPPYDECRLWDLISESERRMQAAVAEIVRRDTRKRLLEAWLDDPRNYIDPRYGEALMRLGRTDWAIRSTWRSVATAIGWFVGAGSQLGHVPPADLRLTREDLVAYVTAAHGAWVGRAADIGLVDGYLRRPCAEVGDTLLSVARLMAIAHGATTGLAVAPWEELGVLIDTRARTEALRIRKVNHWNQQIDRQQPRLRLEAS